MIDVPEGFFAEKKKRALQGKESDPLMRMERYCPGCGEWTVWDYYEAPALSERLYGECLACGVFLRRVGKVYFKNSADNPVHFSERVHFVKDRFLEIVGDKTISIGLPTLPSGAVLARPPYERDVTVTMPRRKGGG